MALTTAVAIVSRIRTHKTQPGMKVSNPIPRSTQTRMVISRTTKNAVVVGLSDRAIKGFLLWFHSYAEQNPLIGGC